MTSQTPRGPKDLVPYHVNYEHLCHDEDAHHVRIRRSDILPKQSIRAYRHATTKWGAALESFSPLWFAICISSGGLGSILDAPFPYQADWLLVISSILYVVDLVFFLLFMAILIARWVMYPHVAVRKAWANPDELGAYAIPPIALLTISSLTATRVSESSWGGHSFTIVSYVLWWIGILWIFVTMLVVFTVHIYNGNQNDRVMSPVIFMAPVGLATGGAEAAFITIHAADMSARLAVPQIIVGYFSVGIAFFMAMALYSTYFHRLLGTGWPPAAKRPALFILVGPCGQLSTALQFLGLSSSGYMRFANYKPSGVNPPDIGTVWRAETAAVIDGAGLLIALLLLGFAYFWFAIAIIGITDLFVKKQAQYSLVWWSLVFPSATFTTAMLGLADGMDSPAFRALTSAMTVLLAILYLVNWGFTIHGLVTGKLIFAKSQAEFEDELVDRSLVDENGRVKEA